MSHSMRLTTVAEGVEQPEQAAWLKHARCSLGQGFLWSRPVELDAARELLVTGTHRRQPAPLPTGPVGGEGLLSPA
jgi:EAL domain-containing protein (putative c-di-GMP-specific phosphodiesterase class I)